MVSSISMFPTYLRWRFAETRAAHASNPLLALWDLIRVAALARAVWLSAALVSDRRTEPVARAITNAIAEWLDSGALLSAVLVIAVLLAQFEIAITRQLPVFPFLRFGRTWAWVARSFAYPSASVLFSALLACAMLLAGVRGFATVAIFYFSFMLAWR